jgi:hypothetical protein
MSIEDALRKRREDMAFLNLNTPSREDRPSDNIRWAAESEEVKREYAGKWILVSRRKVVAFGDRYEDVCNFPCASKNAVCIAMPPYDGKIYVP